MKRKKKTKKRLAPKLALAVVGLLVGLMLCEVTARSMRLAPLDSYARYTEMRGEDCVRPDADAGYAFIPNQCFANSHGFRDRETPLARQPGELRIMALGDSITFDGWFADFLEPVLEERLGKPVDVWNAGAPGYTLYQEVGLYRSRGHGVDPDLVLLQVCVNDCAHTPVYFEYRGNTLHNENKYGEFKKLSPFWFRWSALYRYIHRTQFGRSGPHYTSGERNPEVEDSLVELQRLTQKHDIPLLVMVIPFMMESEDYPLIERECYEYLNEVLDEQSIPRVELQSMFTEHGIEELRMVHTDEVYGRLGELLTGHRDAQTVWEHVSTNRAEDFAVGKSAHLQDDFYHPNFFGHALITEAVADRVAAEPERFLKGWTAGATPGPDAEDQR